MRNILTALLVVAVLVVAVGVASHAARVDLSYVAGTWHRASLLAVAAIVAALLVVVGLLSAVAAGLLAGRDRRLLEDELQRTYVRLRAAEGSAQAAASAGPSSTSASPSASPSAAPGEAARPDAP
jgi:uncharacterized integral membrane protein